MQPSTGIVQEQAVAASEARPFLKWAGGKSGIMSQLEPLFPRHYRVYHEPFLGGGAVYLHLGAAQAVLSDLNDRLIQCYLAIKHQVGEVITKLERLRRAHNEENYYKARERLNAIDPSDRANLASLQIYLNKTCFNGLYRENRRGQFNVPFGRYRNPGVYTEQNLFAVSHRLASTEIATQPFERVLDQAKSGDFIYFDPPYAPISKTSNFTTYTRHGFNASDQERLADTYNELHRRGCFVMESNSGTDEIRNLYSGFNISRIQARRSINSKAKGRGPVKEYVIRNYS